MVKYFAKGAENCGFFDWYDSPVSSRMRDVVSGLLRRIRRTEEQLKEQKAVTRRLKLWLVVLVGVLVAVVVKGQLVDVFLGGGAVCRGFYVFLGGAAACRVRSCGLLLDENGGVGWMNWLYVCSILDL